MKPKIIIWVGDEPPTLEQAQKLVGGYVEMITFAPKKQMLVDEEGLLKKLPINEEATDLLKKHGREMPLPIVGNALVLQDKAIWK